MTNPLPLARMPTCVSLGQSLSSLVNWILWRTPSFALVIVGNSYWPQLVLTVMSICVLPLPVHAAAKSAIRPIPSTVSCQPNQWIFSLLILLFCYYSIFRFYDHSFFEQKCQYASGYFHSRRPFWLLSDRNITRFIQTIIIFLLCIPCLGLPSLQV